MEALKVLGLVEIDEGHGMTGQEKNMALKPEFKWFLSEEYKQLLNTGSKSRAAATESDAVLVKSLDLKDLPARLQKYTSDQIIADIEEAEAKGEF